MGGGGARGVCGGGGRLGERLGGELELELKHVGGGIYDTCGIRDYTLPATFPFIHSTVC